MVVTNPNGGSDKSNLKPMYRECLSHTAAVGKSADDPPSFRSYDANHGFFPIQF